MYLYADSHGRDFVMRLKEEAPYVTGWIQPGAPFQVVISQIPYTPPGKTIVIIGGTNNTHDKRKTPKEMFKEFNLQLVKSQAKFNPIIILEILQRYDEPSINDAIRKLNLLIIKSLRHTKNVYVVKTHDLQQHHFNYKGLHLRPFGKDLVAKRIVEQYYRIAQAEDVRIGSLVRP